ncbi:DUF305 domain-containing protein [Streptomyces diastatochromogenes]|uniref:DUF305 domain-containing protein n=1 Tax=Streptomyces diastatochromogenes TaxID=42236 RepID=A0A233SA99_STRDA|nr:DUF305 domain-containing protein [Streptomyces diastatochromogenes]MCZ0990928.1 DUF305 domain-containing protein [Streptomyces diastatochromogenes]OXY92419.1 DUF305 domain-containing protein [Streptomyces diastatochromogenes]
MTDSTDAQGRKPAFGRWLIAAAAGLVVLVLALSFLAVDSDRNDMAIDVPTADSADAGFARDMAVHHQQAVEMAYIVRDRTTDEDVRRLAYDIAQTQANQRGMLLGWLDLWKLPVTSPDGYMTWMQGGHMGHQPKDGSLMPGMATNTELARLGTLNGSQAEVLYLQLMYDHHMGGVDMARACARQCTVPQERKLAQGMVDAQQSEMELMAGMLKERGSAPR